MNEKIDEKRLNGDYSQFININIIMPFHWINKKNIVYVICLFILHCVIFTISLSIISNRKRLTNLYISTDTTILFYIMCFC